MYLQQIKSQRRPKPAYPQTYRDSDLINGTWNLEEPSSFISNVLSSDKRASKLQSGSGSAAIPSTFWGQRSSNLTVPLNRLTPPFRPK